MRTTLTLARYQLRVLLRTPGYWATALVLSTLGIVVFGLFLTDPSEPRIGIVDEANSAASSAFIDSARKVERIDVRIGDREEQIEKLRTGERWAVVVLPPQFAENTSLAGVEVWTGDPDAFASFTGAGIITQLLIDSTDAVEPSGIQVLEEPSSGDDPLRFIDVVVPGQVGLSLMFGNLFAAAMLGNWRQQGILRRFAVSRVQPAHLFFSQLMVFGLVSALQATILLSLGHLLFGVEIKGSIMAVIVTVAAGIVAFLTLWYALTALVRSPVAANAIASVLGFVMMFVGGSYIPIDDPPFFLKPIVLIAPLTHLNHALRGVINSGEAIREIATDLGILAGWAAVLLLVSIRAFRWTTEE